jgi:hypothetical protein
MPEKQRRADTDPQVVDNHATRRQQPGAQGAGEAADAREDKAKLRKNQRELGVEPDHKTPDMKKGHRGTFP